MAMASKELHLKGMEMQANRPGFAKNGFDDLELVLTENDLTFGQCSDRRPIPKIKHCGEPDDEFFIQ